MTDPATRATRFLILLLPIWLCACGTSSGVPVEVLQRAVIGGADDDGDPAVVLIIANTQDGKQELCTGTVIGQRTVLTAAHCLAPQVVGRDASFSLFLGPDFRDADARSRPGFTRDVARVEFDREFEADLLHRGHDIGVIFTAAPIELPPVAIGRQPLSAQTLDVRIVGYGLSMTTDVEGNTAGRRRQARVPLLQVRGALVDVGTAELGPCLGDSGGPALAQQDAGTQELLAGLVSYSPRDCDGGAILTALASYLPLIDSWLASEDSIIAQEPPGGCSLAGRRTMSTGDGWFLSWTLLGIALLLCHRRQHS